MNELIAKIEQWAEDRNIINGTNPIDQAMKLFSEFGELADNVGKGRDCRDDIGDCMVVLTIIAKQLNLPMVDFLEFPHNVIDSDLKETVAFFGCELGKLLADQGDDYDLGFLVCIGLLHSIAIKKDTTLQECVQIAYDDIKDRHGYIKNGIFIKLSDMTTDDRDEYEKSINDRS